MLERNSDFLKKKRKTLISLPAALRVRFLILGHATGTKDDGKHYEGWDAGHKEEKERVRIAAARLKRCGL